MAVSLSANEEAQLSQTVEMFEVITQSQPLDYQSLEILKEAYAKLNRQSDAVRTSKRIAEAYVHLGQISSAILEYESILQRLPDDPDVRKALSEIELKASNLATPKAPFPMGQKPPPPAPGPAKKSEKRSTQVDDGRQVMQSIFVDGRFLSEADFNLCWPNTDQIDHLKHPTQPFIQILAERQLVPVETSLNLLIEKSRLGLMPLEKYDVDVELARSFPRELCHRWCILPFDRMSKSVLVATANPFNRQATQELEACTKSRLLWYVTVPTELLKTLQKIFR